MSRENGRRPDELRPIAADPLFLEQPHGMVLWSQGKTRVLCTASITEGVPRWLYRSGRGWLTAEYSLLPASTGERSEREAARGKQGGRTVEIQRLIGRAVRAVVDVEATAERVPFDRERLDGLLDLAAAGIEELDGRQQEAVDAPRE